MINMLPISCRTDAENVHLSMGIVLIMNKMRIVCKWTCTRIKDKQILWKNMTVLFVVSDQSHVLRVVNPVSYQNTGGALLEFAMRTTMHGKSRVSSAISVCDN